ncbi:triacylglycerol lipase [Trichodelitschia bisporula]|uniref:Triacylglycerol lipase n=1 Tax=Trichodelitschia bisporula TaxID=703511 RepID=A0A6G1I109_9PEZI|nr:triacylglycerol lipase [Trichodelitschia bisporula]
MKYAKVPKEKPVNPIVLAHGLLGFDELHLVSPSLPGIRYWRGITEELSRRGVEVITARVPPSGSIEARAARLAASIAEKASGKSVNIIAHSMVWLGKGLDSRYMISQLRPNQVDVRTLTTIATPHRGSAFADYMLEAIGTDRLPKVYHMLEYFGLETGAFSQLTRQYMAQNFNPKTPDVEGIKYYSYGAYLEAKNWSIFRPAYDIIRDLEGAPNDGLVSVPSSKWGTYKGTLVGVSHLEVINWTNGFKQLLGLLTASNNFNAVAFYLAIADMLAKEGH